MRSSLIKDSNIQIIIIKMGNGLTVKKIISLILSLVLVFCLAGCGAKTDTSKNTGDVKSTGYVGQDWASDYYDESMKGTTLNLYGVERPEGIIDINTVKLFATDFKANAEKRDTILDKWSEYITAAGK